jgi:hypothetical protein
LRLGQRGLALIDEMLGRLDPSLILSQLIP